MTKTITTLICALLLAAPLSAQDLELPERLPELQEADISSLGQSDTGIAVGKKVPAFSVVTHKGESMALSRLLGQAPIMVVFYRGGWCPYCNTQIRQLTEAWPEFERRGVTPVLISADKPDASAMAQATYEIPFPVLSDPDLKAHEAFDVVVQIDDATAKKYRGYGIVLEDWSGRDHHKIAAPGVFLLDGNGIVQWAHVSEDYKTRPSVEQLLAVLDSRADS